MPTIPIPPEDMDLFFPDLQGGRPAQIVHEQVDVNIDAGDVANNDNERGANGDNDDDQVNQKQTQGKLGSMRAFFTMDEIQPGKAAYIKYLGFWHAILITGKDPARNLVTAVHFAWQSVFQRRIIKEDEFNFDLSKQELWEVFIPEDMRQDPEEAVRLARAMKGQKGFNARTRRSSHIVMECAMKR